MSNERAKMIENQLWDSVKQFDEVQLPGKDSTVICI